METLRKNWRKASSLVTTHWQRRPWRKVINTRLLWIVIGLLALLLILLISSIAILPFVTSPHIWPFDKYINPISDSTTSADRADVVQAQIALFAVTIQILGGSILIATLWSAIQNNRHTQHSLDIAREGQITDRFTKAIDQLGARDDNGNPRLVVRHT